MNRRSWSCLSSGLCALVVLLTACGGADHDESATGTGSSPATATSDTDAELCADYCARLPTTCPAAADEMKGADCKTACLGAPDSSTPFRHCIAQATSCAELKICKATH